MPIDHATIRLPDREASRAFYTAALGDPTAEDDDLLDSDDHDR